MSSTGLPWQAQTDVLPTFFAGVSAQGRVDREVAVDVLRGALDLATAWIGVDITWSTCAEVEEEDLRSPTANVI